MTENHFIGGASSLQNELIKLLSENGYNSDNASNDVSNKDISNDASNKDNSNDGYNDMEEMKLNEIIKDSVETQSMLDAQYVNQELTGGTSIVGLVDNILAGGNLNNANSTSNNANADVSNANSASIDANMKPNENKSEDIISNIYENSPNDDNKGEEIIENIYENSPNDSKLKGGKINKNKMSPKHDSGDDNDDNDDNEDPNYDPDMDESNNEDNDSDDEDDINSVDSVDSDDDSDDEEERNGFIKIINEMREYAKENEVPRPNEATNSTNSSLELSGGNVKSANRVRILNMYPYILKSID